MNYILEPVYIFWPVSDITVLLKSGWWIASPFFQKTLYIIIISSILKEIENCKQHFLSFL